MADFVDQFEEEERRRRGLQPTIPGYRGDAPTSEHLIGNGVAIHPSLPVEQAVSPQPAEQEANGLQAEPRINPLTGKPEGSVGNVMVGPGASQGRSDGQSWYAPGFEPGGANSPYAPSRVLRDAYDHTDPNAMNQVQQLERAQDAIRDDDSYNDVQKADAYKQLTRRLDRIDPRKQYRRGSPATQRSKIDDYFAQNVKKVDGGFLAIDGRGTPHYFKVDEGKQRQSWEAHQARMAQQSQQFEFKMKQDMAKIQLQLEQAKVEAAATNMEKATKHREKEDTTYAKEFHTRKTAHDLKVSSHPYVKQKPAQKFKLNKYGQPTDIETSESLEMWKEHQALKDKTDDEIAKEARDFLDKQRGQTAEKPAEKPKEDDAKKAAQGVAETIRKKAKEVGAANLTMEERKALAEALKALAE